MSILPKTAAGWSRSIATPSALAFLDPVPKVKAETGLPVRSQHRRPRRGQDPATADAIIVAPATFNTINKWANGISGTYALGILAEAPGLGIRTVVLPFVNSALAGRTAFKQNVNALRSEGVQAPAGARTVRAARSRIRRRQDFRFPVDACAGINLERMTRKAREGSDGTKRSSVSVAALNISLR